MFKLCICDDKETEINEIRQLVKQFSKEHPELPVQIQVFQSAHDLLEYIKVYGGFDLYLLDILMPDLTGMDLAQKIRDRGETAEILFLTVSREFALEAFGVKAAGYLLKPVDREEFDQAVLSCIRRLTPKESPSLILKTKDGVRKVRICELLMIESFNHSRVCTLSDGTNIETPDTITSLNRQLCEYPCFYVPHRAYIVNFDYVNGLSVSELLMTNGKRIPVSRRVYADLKNAFMEYVMKGI